MTSNQLVYVGLVGGSDFLASELAFSNLFHSWRTFRFDTKRKQARFLTHAVPGGEHMAGSLQRISHSILLTMKRGPKPASLQEIPHQAFY